MSEAKTTLYPLLFGNRTKVQVWSVLQMQEQMQRALGWHAEYNAIGDSAAFTTQQSSVVVNGLKITALTHTPIRTRVDANELTFFMPVDGGAIQSRVNGEHVRRDPTRDALLAPEGERIGTGSSRSLVVAKRGKARVLETARAMLSDDARLDLERPTVLSLDMGEMNFDLLLRSACKALDACQMNGQAAAAVGLDDLFYRTICAMMLRGRLFPETAKTPATSGIMGSLEQTCQYIAAHLDNRISMTELEQISGLSTRSLQYAFQKRFGCTPITWIRNERLNAARDRLMAANEDTTVTNVALAFSFTNLGNFSKYYLDKFGEYPSQTLSTARMKN
ncbi:helix-turn-helix domain-containing protein [Xanthobacter agilis]|uniref:AraC-like DNA-binding protein n=1 Tax=Xanthobacter agilis TaxID=47492 RepID=A0ABU0LHR0_XANAG|nr:AraC family transcriptional regulator [Xanthobacter agilis]MDQ0506627.1 AraC-like DNA-binding protein [Xanthobacter agilis]